jgi:hypothetical protein
VAIATALLGVAGSAITATYTFAASYTQQTFERQVKNRELALAELKEDHAIEKEYVLKAADSQSSPEARSRILRYLTVSPRVAPETKEWAKTELAQVGVELSAQTAALEGAVAEATASLAQTKTRLAQLESQRDAEARRRLEEEQREQEASLTRLTARAETSRKIGQRVEALARPAVGTRSCKPGTVRAVALGPDDPDQSTADAQCMGSAAGREFGPSAGARVTWLTRRAGRNFQCECQLS